MSVNDERPGLDLELLAATFRTDLSDAHAFVEGLAIKLEGLLPTRVRVDRRKQGMFGPKLVRRIEFDGGGQRFELRYDGRAIETRASKLSRGIVIKSQELDMDAWLDALGEALAAEAQRSESTRQALERLLMR
jgi:uncharacterized protein YhdP